ncbi:MAG: DUF5312 family protein [Spirochaetales bacterium]
MGSSSEENSPEPLKETPPPKSNFFERLIGLIFGFGDPEKEKKRLLKNIAKELKRSKHKFYSPKNKQVLPPLAQFFYEIYKVVGSAQVLLQNAQSSGALRSLIIEASLNEKELVLVESLSEEKIRERAKSSDLKTLVQELKDQIINLFALFDHEKIKQINLLNSALNQFLSFVMFDYHFMLKKFDPNLSERDFNYLPKFEPIHGEYVSDDLKDFLELLLPLDTSYDWEALFEVLKAYRNVDVVSRPAWKKLLGLLENVRKNGVLELIVRHLDQNPFYKPTLHVSSERIVEPYLNKIKTQTELLIQKIVQERKNQQIDQLVRKIFGGPAVLRMRNYTDKANITFSKKMVGGYIYTEPANYLKAFFLDYIKKDVRELRDLLIVRGKWATNLLSQQLSESFHALVELSDELIRFDDGCADEGEYGQKIRKVINRVERDPGAMKVLRDTIKFLNDRIARILSESGRQMIVFGKNLKNLIDDYAKNPKSEILINWKEVDQAAEGKINEKMVEVYKKIYLFIQLLQLFVKEEAKQA